jgi:hypothetical protein
VRGGEYQGNFEWDSLSVPVILCFVTSIWLTGGVPAMLRPRQ